jgi:hypothetical protein
MRSCAATTNLLDSPRWLIHRVTHSLIDKMAKTQIGVVALARWARTLAQLSRREELPGRNGYPAGGQETDNLLVVNTIAELAKGLERPRCARRASLTG